MAAPHLHLVASSHHCLSVANAIRACLETLRTCEKHEKSRNKGHEWSVCSMNNQDWVITSFDSSDTRVELVCIELLGKSNLFLLILVQLHENTGIR